MKHKEQIHQLNKSAWDKVVKPFSEYRSNIEVTSLFKDFSDRFKKKSHILDLGCGTGIPFGKYLVNKGHTLNGIDYSVGMIEKAKINVPEGDFKVQSIDKISNKNFYDGIVASYSLQLLDPDSFKRVVALCSTALKKDGLIYISLNEAITRKSDYAVFMGEKMYFKDYSEGDLLTIFKDNNLEKIDLSRSVEDSETFGKEYMIEIIFQKKPAYK